MNAGLSKVDREANDVTELRDEGRPPLAVSLKVASRLSGLGESDLLRAAHRGLLDARWADGKIVVIYCTLENYVLGLERCA